MVYAAGTGAGKRTRTADLLITNQLLYQLSYPGTGSILPEATSYVNDCGIVSVFSIT